MQFERGDGAIDVFVVPLTALSASQPAYSGACWLLGFSVMETTGAAVASVTFYDGQDVNGKLLDRVSVSAGGTDRYNPGQPGMPVEAGIFVDVVSGTVDLSLVIGRDLTP